MHHIFIYAKPVDPKATELVLSEIAAIRTDGSIGFKGTKKASILGTYFVDDVSNIEVVSKDFVSELMKSWPHDKFVVVTAHQDQLRALVKRLIPVYDRLWIDLRSLAWPMVFSGVMQSATLPVICHHFNVDYRDEMDSADMCQAMVQVYTAMMRRITTALGAEEVVRDIGGETLSKVRNLFGF